MIYLSGTTNDVIEPALIDAGIGLMIQPGSGYAGRVDRYDAWAADNGCFSKGDLFNEPQWIRWLAGLPTGALFAVAPDVLCDATATWERSSPWFDQIRALGFPAAWVAQNGAENAMIDWAAFDAVFIGGDTDWKLSEAAYRICAEGRERGKWIHVGRVNTVSRLRTLATVDTVNSVDGTYLRWGPDINLPKLTRWLASLDDNPQMVMP